MDVMQVLHMVGGVGETSYASNSLLQKKALDKAKPMVQQTLADLYSSILPHSMAIVDLGCSSGPNALVVAQEITDSIRETSGRHGRTLPEIQYFFNDLPGNDFNTLFRSSASFQERLTEEQGGSEVPFYVAGVPGSFYGRLFPRDSIHLAYSSYCLHFLSQVPPEVESNKKNIYLSWTSPEHVFQSYFEQFQKDFTLFLKLRSEELVFGGRMLLVFLGRGNADPFTGECSHLMKLLADALVDMASKGLIEEAKVDSFNLPIYTPSAEELVAVIQNEGSFDIVKCDSFQLNWDPTDDILENIVANKSLSGENVAKSIRAVMESIIISHFGEAIIDELFSRYAQNVAMHLSKEKTKYFHLSISLKNKARGKAQCILTAG